MISFIFQNYNLVLQPLRQSNFACLPRLDPVWSWFGPILSCLCGNRDMSGVDRNWPRHCKQNYWIYCMPTFFCILNEIPVRSVSTWLCTCAHFFRHCLWHMFDDLNRDFVANLFRNRGTHFLGYFSGHINWVFDTDCFREVFAGLSGYEDGKILALFLWYFFTFCLGHLFFNFSWNLKVLKMG